MNRKDILRALDEISDARIEKAANPPSRKGKQAYWYSGIAAVLAVAILVSIFLPDRTPLAHMENPDIPTFSDKQEPAGTVPPNSGGDNGVHENEPGVPTYPWQPTSGYKDTQPTVIPTTPPVVPTQTYDTTYDPQGNTEGPTRATVTAPTEPSGGVTLSTSPSFVSLAAKEYNWPVYPKESTYVDASQQAIALRTFFTQTMYRCLTGDEQNAAYSPINLYMALAMLAETTSGESRAEILSALGADSMADLRQTVTTMWNSAYQTGKYPCLLANSLWLQDGGVYHNDVLKTLQDVYYANAYGVDFRQNGAAEAVRNWINKQTEGTLREHTSGLAFDPETVMSLVSTVYYKSLWSVPFYEKANTQSVFHGTNGDVTRTFMNKETISKYYQGDDFGAMSLSLYHGYKMWLILPEEGKTPKDLLQSGNYAKLFLGGDVSRQEAIITLSLPKFDISCKQNLVGSLQRMGIESVFQPGVADFSSLTDTDIAVNKVEQATRVAIDEKGVTAASYAIIDAVTSPLPPPLQVDFTLDRPFLFVITNSSNVPLFAGTVKNP